MMTLKLPFLKIIQMPCYDEIKIAWLGKVKSGDNAMVDSEIDDCLGIH
jgi:hypothetical protein